MSRSGVAAAAVLLVACAGEPEGGEDTRVINPARDVYEEWVKIEPEGVVCGDGSPYKMFVNWSNKSDNLVVVWEPGGACWDFASCAGKNGIRGAANPNGLPDDHWKFAPFVSPFLSRIDDTNPSREWNMLYVPYCTGDVHTGATTVTYAGENGEPDLVFHHDGHAINQKAVEWIDSQFTHMPKLLATGCSAGGVASLVNYRFLRNGIRAFEKGYLLDDSGPIFPSSGYSRPMHTKIREAWNLDALTPEMPAGFTLDDMGSINTAIANEFPDDRLAITYFRRDYNFSKYSYERFYDFPPKEEMLSMWEADTQLLINELDQLDNFHYFIPYYRAINDSHCTTVINFAGSDIQDHDTTLAEWIDDFVNDRPMESMIEAPVPGEDD